MKNRARATWLAASVLSGILVLTECRAALAEVGDPVLERGRYFYGSYCAACHGEHGKGDGPAAPALKTPPTDLTQIARRRGGKFPLAEVQQFIDGERPVSAHGSRDMPLWGRVFRAGPPQGERLGARQAAPEDLGASPEESTGTGTEAAARARVNALTKYLESIQVR